MGTSSTSESWEMPPAVKQGCTTADEVPMPAENRACHPVADWLKGLPAGDTPFSDVDDHELRATVTGQSGVQNDQVHSGSMANSGTHDLPFPKGSDSLYDNGADGGHRFHRCERHTSLILRITLLVMGITSAQLLATFVTCCRSNDNHISPRSSYTRGTEDILQYRCEAAKSGSEEEVSEYLARPDESNYLAELTANSRVELREQANGSARVWYAHYTLPIPEDLIERLSWRKICLVRLALDQVRGELDDTNKQLHDIKQRAETAETALQAARLAKLDELLASLADFIRERRQNRQ